MSASVLTSFFRLGYRALLKGLIATRSAFFCIRLKLSRTALFGQLRLGRILVKVPVRCDGWGIVWIGNDVHIGSEMAPRLGNGEVLLQTRDKEARIQIGDGTRLSNNVALVAAQGISIGAICLIGDGVSIFDSDFHELEPHLRWLGPGRSMPVVIEDNVLIGSRCLILKGVRIGRNSVVAAASVVTKSVPDDVTVAGNPARVVRRFYGELGERREEVTKCRGGNE